MNVQMSPADIKSACSKIDVDISTLEPLPGGGVRLVCMSIDGAAKMRHSLRTKLMPDDAARFALTSRRVIW